MKTNYYDFYKLATELQQQGRQAALKDLKAISEVDNKFLAKLTEKGDGVNLNEVELLLPPLKLVEVRKVIEKDYPNIEQNVYFFKPANFSFKSLEKEDLKEFIYSKLVNKYVTGYFQSIHDFTKNWSNKYVLLDLKHGIIIDVFKTVDQALDHLFLWKGGSGIRLHKKAYEPVSYHKKYETVKEFLVKDYGIFKINDFMNEQLISLVKFLSTK